MTDPGAMTTTEDVTRTVQDSYNAVDNQLHTLADEGIIERRIFANEEVWVVPDDSEQNPARTLMPTNTRDPHGGK